MAGLFESSSVQSSQLHKVYVSESALLKPNRKSLLLAIKAPPVMSKSTAVKRFSLSVGFLPLSQGTGSSFLADLELRRW